MRKHATASAFSVLLSFGNEEENTLIRMYPDEKPSRVLNNFIDGGRCLASFDSMENCIDRGM